MKRMGSARVGAVLLACQGRGRRKGGTKPAFADEW